MSRVTNMAAARTRDDEQQRPHVAQERADGATVLRQPLGERSGAQEEEPGGADDQPDAAELRGELAQVREDAAEREHRRERRRDEQHADADPADAPARPLRRLAADREQPGEAARQRPRAGRRATDKVSIASQRWPWW